jgi:hypothetical protein
MLTLIEITTIGFSLLLIVSLRSSVSLGVLLHQSMFVLFVMVGQMSYRISSDAQYDTLLYIVTNVVCFVYLFILSMLSIISNKGRSNSVQIIDICKRLNDRSWTFPIATWLLIQILLIYKYGISSLYLFRYEDLAQSGLTYFDQSASTLSALLGYGAIVIFIVKSVTIQQFVSSKTNIAIALAFVIPNFILGGSGMGARRFMLSLLLLFAVLIIRKSNLLHKYFLKVLVLVALSLLGSWYFQNIRNNAGSFEVVNLVSSESVIDQLKGIGKFLAPTESPDVVTDYFRSTPFDLVSQAMSQLLENRISVSGDIAWNSIQVIVPRIFFETKPDEMTDDLIASELGIPFNPLTDDLPASVLAITIADFGWSGIPLAAIISFLSIALIEWLVVRQGYRILSIPFFGAWFSIVFGVETSLVQVFAIIRDAVTVFMVLWVIYTFWRYRVGQR